jgi:hypothetical protein
VHHSVSMALSFDLRVYGDLFANVIRYADEIINFTITHARIQCVLEELAQLLMMCNSGS